MWDFRLEGQTFPHPLIKGYFHYLIIQLFNYISFNYKNENNESRNRSPESLPLKNLIRNIIPTYKTIMANCEKHFTVVIITTKKKKSLTSLAKMEMAVNYKRASLLHSKYECDCKKSFVEEADDEKRPLTEVF